jgi:RNA polymerase sigma factor (sigma-70 family)
MSKELKRRPTEAELSKELDIPIKKVKILLSVPDEIVSLDKGVNDGQSTNLATLLPDKSSSDPQEVLIGLSIRNLIREDVAELTDKESEVIKLRYGFQDKEPMKLREIAKKLEMSPEGIRRIELKALKKLKNKLTQQGVYGVLN